MPEFLAPPKAQRDGTPMEVLWVYITKGHANEAAAKAGLAAKHGATISGAVASTVTGTTYDMVKCAGATPDWLSQQSWIGAVARAIPAAGHHPTRISLAPTPETRMIWVEATHAHLIGQTYIENTVARMVEAGFNAVAPYIWHGSGAFWAPGGVRDTSLVRFSANATFVSRHVAGTDDFKILLDTCAAYGVDVFPVFTATLKDQSDIHHEWLPAGGKPEGHYDSHNDDFRAWLTDGVGYAGTGTAGLIKEVVDNYAAHPAFKGIILDYIRTGAGFYQNTAWNAAYAAEFGRDQTADHTAMTAFKDDALDDLLAHRDSPAYQNLCLWHERYIGDIVRRTRSMLKAADPTLILATYGDPFEGISMDQGRVPAKWLEDGDIDIAFRSAYKIGNDPAEPPEGIQWDDFENELAALTILGREDHYVTLMGDYDVDSSGQFIDARDGVRMNTIMAEARTTVGSPNGRAIYLYNQFIDDQKDALKADEFKVHVPTSYVLNGKVRLPTTTITLVIPQVSAYGEDPVVLEVQQVDLKSGTVNTLTGTYEAPAGTTELLFAVMFRTVFGHTITGLSGTFGEDALTQLIPIQSGTSASQNCWLGSISSPSGVQTVAVSAAGGSFSSGVLVAIALKNTAASSIYDTPQARADSGTAASHSFNEPIDANSLILYLVSLNQSTTARTITPATDTVELYNAETGVGSGIHTVAFIGTRTDGVAGTYTVGVNFSAADNFAAACIEIRGV